MALPPGSLPAVTPDFSSLGSTASPITGLTPTAEHPIVPPEGAQLLVPVEALPPSGEQRRPGWLPWVPLGGVVTGLAAALALLWR